MRGRPWWLRRSSLRADDARTQHLLRDVQRDLAFYQTVVTFRNAVERMRVAKGSVDPDEVHWWWGFGYLGWPHAGLGGNDGPEWNPDDDMAGSRVPRRPYGGAGAAGAEVPEPVKDDGVEEVRQIPA
jgi:hypothetical protein